MDYVSERNRKVQLSWIFDGGKGMDVDGSFV